VKRSTSTVATSLMFVLTAVLALSLSGCSLFQRGATDSVASGATAPWATGPSSADPQSSAAPTAPVPKAIPGYAMTPASATVQRTFQGVAGKFNGVYSGLTVRNVTRGREMTGTLVLLGLRAELIGNSTVERGLLPGILKGMSGEGARTSTQRIAGQDVAVATTRTTNIVAWYRTGTVVLILATGVDPARTLTFARAYLAAP
jgi:hypothetical protein